METSTASCGLNFRTENRKISTRSFRKCYGVNQNGRICASPSLFEMKPALEYFPPVAGQKRPLFPTGIATAPRGRGKARERDTDRRGPSCTYRAFGRDAAPRSPSCPMQDGPVRIHATARCPSSPRQLLCTWTLMYGSLSAPPRAGHVGALRGLYHHCDKTIYSLGGAR